MIYRAAARWWLLPSPLSIRACRRVLSDIYPIRAPLGTCSGCRSAWEKVMVVE